MFKHLFLMHLKRIFEILLVYADPNLKPCNSSRHLSALSGVSFMLMVQREKPLRDYTVVDLVKYFNRKFKEKNNKERSTIFARDCSIMLKIMHKFHTAKIPLKDIFKFIDKMFEEYPK